MFLLIIQITESIVVRRFRRALPHWLSANARSLDGIGLTENYLRVKILDPPIYTDTPSA